MHIQVMTEQQAEQLSHDPFDVTKVWSRHDFPLIEVRKPLTGLLVHSSICDQDLCVKSETGKLQYADGAVAMICWRVASGHLYLYLQALRVVGLSQFVSRSRVFQLSTRDLLGGGYIKAHLISV